MRKSFFLIFAVMMMLASSCGSYKRLAYIQDMVPGVDYPVSTANDVRIHKDDKISIVVSGSTPTLAAPFNLVTAVPTFDPVTGESRYAISDENAVPEYLVDSAGNIDFPVLGKIHVEGLTLADVRQVIGDKIRDKKLMTDPIVQVDFVNFRITVLGEIGAGNYVITEGGVNIFEAIAEAGDLTVDANRKDVIVVRTEGEKREVYSLDLTSSSCYYSPAFYLRQNDMVYVKPVKTKADANVNNVVRWISMVVSSLSLVSSAFILLKLYAK